MDFRRRNKNHTEATPLLPPNTASTGSGSATTVATPLERKEPMMALRDNTTHSRPGSPLSPHLGHRWTSSRLRDFLHPFMYPSDDAPSIASTAAKNDEDFEHVERLDTLGPSPPAGYIQQRRRRDDNVSVSTSDSYSNLMAIHPSETVDFPRELSSRRSLHIVLDAAKSDMSFDEISHSEAEMVTGNGWEEASDRIICFLWFFTSYSLTTIAELLGFAHASESERWHQGEDLRYRLVELIGGRDEHSFVYYEVKRSFERRHTVDASKEFPDLERHLAKSWRAMQDNLARDVTKQEHYRNLHTRSGALGGAGFEDSQCTPEEREHLLNLEWESLRRPGKGGVGRPKSIREVDRMSVIARCVGRKSPRCGESRRSKAGSWFGSGWR